MTKGEQGVPEPAQRRPGRQRVPPSRPSAKAMQAGWGAASGRGASGEDAALASAFGLRLTQRAEESACRTGGPERHDRVLFLPCLTEPQRAERRRRRRRPQPHGIQNMRDIPLSMPVGSACGGIGRPARPMGGEGVGQAVAGYMPGGCMRRDRVPARWRLLGRGGRWWPTPRAGARLARPSVTPDCGIVRPRLSRPRRRRRSADRLWQPTPAQVRTQPASAPCPLTDLCISNARLGWRQASPARRAHVAGRGQRGLRIPAPVSSLTA